MAAGSPQRAGAEAFTTPNQVNQRRYEALRAFFVDGLTHAQAGQRFGYTRWAMVNLVREHRAEKLELFAPPRRPGPPPGVAPAKDRARARVIELRRQGLSTYEISARLATQGTPLNRTSVGEILTEEGFGRLLRTPDAHASTAPATPGRDTHLPRTAPLDFATWPERLDTDRAGLLLLVPDLVALDLPALIRAAGYPGTRVVPATSWLLSLLALKLTRTRRVSHVDDLLLSDPAAALFAALATLPKKSALTDYSYRTSHKNQRAFLAALDTAMIAGGLATREEAIFDLDFHAVMAWGSDPALEKHYVPTRSQRSRSVLTFFAQDSGTHNLVYANADLSKATQNREVIAFCDHWKAASGADPCAGPIPDLVCRDFTAQAPGQKMVGDITYIPTWEGWLYLATVIDCHTKAVIGWAMGDNYKTPLISAAITMAARNHSLEPGAIFHSDRGSNYTSAQFADTLAALDLRHSVGRTGICYDNAMAESFFGALKNELVHRTVYPTRPGFFTGVMGLSPELQAWHFDHGFLFAGRVGVRLSRRGAGFHAPGGCSFHDRRAGGGGQVGAGRTLTARQALIRSSIQGQSARRCSHRVRCPRVRRAGRCSSR